MRARAWHLAVLLALACGDGGGNNGKVSVAGKHAIAAPADNVVPVHVDIGIPNVPYINGLFATVTVCMPGTEQCQDIEHVLVDTGSTGLRVMGSALTLKLPVLTDDQGVALAECGQFVGGFTWGPMASADFKWGAKSASNLPVHVIEKTTFPVPSACTGQDVGDAQTLGANGILGIGHSIQDCGEACTPNPAGFSNPKLYYACASANAGGCTVTAVPLEKQLTNPVPLFSQDNNGTIIQLPPIPAMGAELVNGSLVFGIGTRDNNALGDVHVMHLNELGLFQSMYSSKGAAFSGSNSANWVPAFIDSGSNGLFFLDSVQANIPICTNSKIDSFYCPSSTKTLIAQAQSDLGLDDISIQFSIANTLTLMTQSKLNVAFNDLGGPSTAPQSGPPDSNFSSYFDYGLPFYYGRNVYTAIENQPTPIGPGPFVAF